MTPQQRFHQAQRRKRGIVDVAPAVRTTPAPDPSTTATYQHELARYKERHAARLAVVIEAARAQMAEQELTVQKKRNRHARANAGKASTAKAAARRKALTSRTHFKCGHPRRGNSYRHKVRDGSSFTSCKTCVSARNLARYYRRRMRASDALSAGSSRTYVAPNV